MTTNRRIARRAVLRVGAAGSLVGPFLKLLERRAQAAAPRRLILFATPNGAAVDGDWIPGPGLAFGPGHVLGPLEPLKHKMLFVHGVRMYTVEKRPSPRDHGRHYPNGLVARQPAVPEVGFGPIAGISIDQEIANAVGGGTKFRSLQLGVMAYGGHPLMARGYAQPIAPENNAPKLFQRLFADLAPPASDGAAAAARERLAADRRSTLDHVKGELTRLRCELGGPERAALDAHLESVRALEATIFFKPAAGAACDRPVLERTASGNAEFPKIGKNMMDMIVRAAACDLSRVIALQWSSSGSQIVHGWVDPAITFGHHDVAHGRPAWRKPIETWYAKQFFYLCSQLDGVRDADGRTLLDNSAVIWLREQGDGAAHLNRNMPYVIAGGCQGFFKRGQAVALDGEAHNNLLITWAHAMGVRLTTFGDPEFSRGPVPQIIA